jgi:hypothetical protein
MPELFYELDAQFTPLLPLSVGVAGALIHSKYRASACSSVTGLSGRQRRRRQSRQLQFVVVLARGQLRQQPLASINSQPRPCDVVVVHHDAIPVLRIVATAVIRDI